MSNKHTKIYKSFDKFKDIIGHHRIMQKIESLFPELSYENLFILYIDTLEKHNKKMVFHVFSMMEKALALSMERGITKTELEETLIAIFYHDFVKLFEKKLFF